MNKKREPEQELVEKQRRKEQHGTNPDKYEPKEGFAKDGNARGVVPKNSDDQPKKKKHE
ncbi:hypothetical protein IRY55_10870 [Savagea sp. SN6]|uniref:Uncharacterized protein n=1 Tax=Savagea serpentis TaxID=2785297 RepID=A0A8J7G423_9BACL|nr:hypothetical protein [Savagea serpentis]MBF4501865.1 hypothetical protein [Savagea serpentis]